MPDINIHIYNWSDIAIHCDVLFTFQTINSDAFWMKLSQKAAVNASA